MGTPIRSRDKRPRNPCCCPHTRCPCPWRTIIRITIFSTISHAISAHTCWSSMATPTNVPTI
eukprot:Gb_07179 [translate_table: standard]